MNFQETAWFLAKAALRRRINWFKGLKENLKDPKEGSSINPNCLFEDLSHPSGYSKELFLWRRVTDHSYFRT